MTEVSGSLNARAAGSIPRSPAIPTLIMVVGLAVSLARPSFDQFRIDLRYGRNRGGNCACERYRR